MTESEAQQIAEAYLNQECYSVQRVAQTGPLVIMPERTIAKEYGWIFQYETQKHRETGELQYALAGDFPIVVEKTTGKVMPLQRTMESVSNLEEAIKEFEQTLGDDETSNNPQ